MSLENILQTMQIPLVDKIVAFGTGSPLTYKPAIFMDLNDIDGFVSRDQIEMHRHRFTQYAILMWMAGFFQQRQGGQNHVQVYVQDPDLKATDEDAMEQLGFKILDGEYDCQEGFAKIDDRTFVYDAVISSSISQIYMEYAYPAAVMTEHLDRPHVGPYHELQDHHKYVYLQDTSGIIVGGNQFLWPQPLRP